MMRSTKQKIKWIWTLAIAFVLILTLMTVTVMATEAAPAAVVESGKCGDDLTWTVYEDGLLTITGTGAMDDYADEYSTPWYPHRDLVTDVELGDGITYVGSCAFRYSNIQTLVISSSKTQFASGAVSSCYSLTSVTLPVDFDFTTEAFSGCNSVKSIRYTVGDTGVMPDRVYEGNYYSAANAVQRSLEYVCRTSLTSVTFDEGITRIGDYAFFGGESGYYSNSLSSVKFPSTLTSIGDYAFGYCVSLTSDTLRALPAGLSELGTGCFKYCKGLTELVLPAGLTAIPESCFEGCDGFADITIPATVKNIGAYCFKECYGLKNVTIPASVEYVGQLAFRDSYMETLIISSSKTKFGEDAFGYCNSLTSVALPVDYDITTRAFYGTGNVQSIHYTVGDTGIMADREYVGDYYYGTERPVQHTLEYQSRDSLTSVTFDEGITHIGSNAFRSNSSLSSVTIPASVTSIGSDAFNYCSGLSHVIFKGDPPEIGYNAFYCVTANAYSPANNENWTEEDMDNYGGTLTWNAPCTEHIAGEAVEENRVESTAVAAGSYDSVVYCSVCGTELSRETITLPLAADPFRGTTMSLDTSLAMNFVVDMTKLSGEGFYAIITRDYADQESVSIRVDEAAWTNYKTDGSQKRITYNDLAARAMCDRVQVAVYNSNGVLLGVREDSLRDYAMRNIENYMKPEKLDPVRLAMYVDMLNYGAAAQEKFTYNTGNLANNRLTAEMQAYATPTVTDGVNAQVKGTGYAGSTLNLASEIELNFVFNKSVVTQEMYAVITFVNHRGKTITNRIEGSDFTEYSTTRWRLTVKGLVMADGAQVVTCTIYNADGSVVSTSQDSMESVCVRDNGKSDLYTTTLKLTRSAYAYFHSND